MHIQIGDSSESGAVDRYHRVSGSGYESVDRVTPHRPVVPAFYDIATGAVIQGQATRAPEVYEVREIEGEIRLRARSR